MEKKAGVKNDWNNNVSQKTVNVCNVCFTAVLSASAGRILILLRQKLNMDLDITPH